MLVESGTFVDIKKLIREESIMIHFQPIVSIKRKSLVGLEALCRGVYKGQVIPPATLFNLAEQQGFTLQLDRLCRKKAMEEFVDIARYNEKFILFINFDSSILDQGVVGSGNILNTVTSLGLSPDRIVIEINEAKANNIEALDIFINSYKDHGFMIALDDIGAGYSSLNRVAIVKPDILKIDRMLIKDIDKEFYKQEVVRSLVNLSKKLGALVVAEGIETEEEAITSLNIGADMLQGYHFSKPSRFDNIDFGLMKSKKQFIASQYKNYALQKANKEKRQKEYFESMSKSISEVMEGIDRDMIDIRLTDIVSSYDNIECAYVLDASGIQLSDTVCSISDCLIRKKAIFSPALKGTDHSLKDYYYLNIGEKSDIYMTEPYISSATGNLSVTVSILFNDKNDERLFMCMDAIVEG